jgi:catechol 2,3-dioxygenase-like lactoylglutathione lyase family enzyme
LKREEKEQMSKAISQKAAPYADDALNLPVADVDEAIPFYEQTMGFKVVTRNDAPHKSAILARDDIQIGLAENGGDPEQEGCFFEVENLGAAFAEIKGKPATDSDFRIDQTSTGPMKVFFVVAPDGLCFMLGERL